MILRKVLNLLMIRTFLFKISIILLGLLTFSLCEDTVQVNLENGDLLGKVETSFLNNRVYYAFRGIPYAEPPVGDLRFQPPKPYTRWPNTYEAYDHKPTCLQFNLKTRNDEPFGISGSEDCLYLSIYTPNLKGNYPVVVFDFNDHFKTGFNGSRTYSPDLFIEEDVIVVYISHRLGLFGYLTTEDAVIPANIGVRDFVLGLHWIKDNIEKFGGDPSRVTLMGNKGGAALISVLLYSIKAKGLFSAVILQSGTALEPGYFYENPRAKAYQLAEELGLKLDDSKTLLTELQALDAEKLLFEATKIYDTEGQKRNQRTAEILALTVEKDHEDAIIRDLPEKSKIVNDVPVIIGLTSREGLDMVADFLFDPKIFQKVLGGIVMSLPIRTNFRFDENSTIFNGDARREMNEVYYKDGYLRLKNLLEYAILIGDTFVGYAVDKTAKGLSKSLESPVYYYMFDYRGVLNENTETIAKYSRISVEQWGATVTDDLCYLFICSRIKKTYEQIGGLVSEQTEFKVLKKMVRLWTNFAKTRNPTPNQEDNILKGVTWTPIDKENGEVNYLHITKLFKMKKEPLGRRAKFWDEFLDKYSKLTVDGVVTNPNNSVDNKMNVKDTEEIDVEKTETQKSQADQDNEAETVSLHKSSKRKDVQPGPVVKVEDNKVIVKVAGENSEPVKPLEEFHEEL